MQLKDKVLKALIIDDEHLVRNLLRRCINWAEIGIEIVAEASNAEEAMELVEEWHPDMIFTDIYMPHVNGIELSERILEKYPHIKIAILTGFDDFKYAQKSVKAGISDFLLKPIDDEEIMKTAIKLKTEIEEERKKSEEYETLKKQLEEAMSVLNNEQESEDNLDILPDETNISGKKIRPLISDVQNYLIQNMSNAEINLSTAAQTFFINSSYLSRIFKKETGITFMEYLIKIRMKKAIQLLKNTDMKSYEIANSVGIHDSNYFSTCFKKYTGISVSEFRKSSV